MPPKPHTNKKPKPLKPQLTPSQKKTISASAKPKGKAKKPKSIVDDPPETPAPRRSSRNATPTPARPLQLQYATPFRHNSNAADAPPPLSVHKSPNDGIEAAEEEPSKLPVVEEDDEAEKSSSLSGESSSLSGESNGEAKEQDDEEDAKYRGEDEPTHLIREPEEEPALSVDATEEGDEDDAMEKSAGDMQEFPESPGPDNQPEDTPPATTTVPPNTQPAASEPKPTQSAPTVPSSTQPAASKPNAAASKPAPTVPSTQPAASKPKPAQSAPTVPSSTQSTASKPNTAASKPAPTVPSTQPAASKPKPAQSAPTVPSSMQLAASKPNAAASKPKPAQSAPTVPSSSKPAASKPTAVSVNAQKGTKSSNFGPASKTSAVAAPSLSNPYRYRGNQRVTFDVDNISADEDMEVEEPKKKQAKAKAKYIEISPSEEDEEIEVIEEPKKKKKTKAKEEKHRTEKPHTAVSSKRKYEAEVGDDGGSKRKKHKSEGEEKTKKKQKKKQRTPTPEPPSSNEASSESESESESEPEPEPVKPSKKSKSQAAVVVATGIPAKKKGTLQWYRLQSNHHGRFAELLKQSFYHQLCGNEWFPSKFQRITLTVQAYTESVKIWVNYTMNFDHVAVPFENDDNARHMCGNLPTEFRGVVKSTAADHVVEAYDLQPPEDYDGTVEEYVQKCVAELDTNTLAFAKSDPAAPVGTHDGIYMIAAKVFYRPEVITDDRELNAVSPLPNRCIALVVVAVQCALRERATGTRVKLPFTESTFKPTFLKLLKDLNTLEKENPAVYREMQSQHEIYRNEALGGGSQWMEAAAAFEELEPSIGDDGDAGETGDAGDAGDVHMEE